MIGYAVFDIETTGFQLHRDSIVEIAVVHVDRCGSITAEWDTLVRPRADRVGPTWVHGINSAMVQHAPTFRDIAPSLLALFAGRIPVAHRLPQFDGRFVGAHFDWAGLPTPQLTRGICTWRHARRHLPIGRHTLSACCAHLGIPLDHAHQALTDTVATAKLLAHFVRAAHSLNGETVPSLTPVAHLASLDGALFVTRAAAFGQRAADNQDRTS